MEFLVKDGWADEVSSIVQKSETQARGTNLVRELTQRAANDLNPGRYIQEVEAFSKNWNVDCEVFGMDKLREMKAGAFVAVAQASPDQDAGIVKLSYNPKAKGKHIVFVGKGVTYDTGGNNLNPRVLCLEWKEIWLAQQWH